MLLLHDKISFSFVTVIGSKLTDIMKVTVSYRKFLENTIYIYRNIFSRKQQHP